MKDTREGDISVTPNFFALDWDLFRLFDPSDARRPRSTTRNAFEYIICEIILRGNKYTHTNDAFTAEITLESACARKLLLGCIQKSVICTESFELFAPASGIFVKKITHCNVSDVED